MCGEGKSLLFAQAQEDKNTISTPWHLSFAMVAKTLFSSCFPGFIILSKMLRFCFEVD